MKTKALTILSLSVKFIPLEGRFFWTLFDVASLAEGRCLDCGFTSDVGEPIATARALLEVRPGKLALIGGSLAHAFYAYFWLGSAHLDPGSPVPQDRAYDIECSRQWDPQPAAPPTELRAAAGDVRRTRRATTEER